MKQLGCGTLTVSSLILICILPVIWAEVFSDAKQSEFVKSLPSYYISHPTLVEKNGQLLSNKLHPSHSRRKRQTHSKVSKTTLHYKIPLPNKYIIVKLQPNHKLYFTDLVIERWRNDYGNLSDIQVSRRSTSEPAIECFYTGIVRSSSFSRVALSVCHGLMGVIHLDGEEYFIEPIKGNDSEKWPHLVYKRSVTQTDNSENPESDFCGLGNTDIPVDNAQRERKNKDMNQFAGRKKRSVSMEMHVETLVVVDQSMLKYYEHDNVENYVLTIMNMVAAVFHDRSIGNAINIVLVRLIFLEENQADLNISHHADKTLASFCKWQKKVNPKSDSDFLHHDTAILMTRHNICTRMNQPCSTLGLAQVSGMCQEHRSCSISEDTGLALAYTIAHELGHLFGMKHDGVHNDCTTSRQTQHVMSPHLIADSSPLKWSKCSRVALTNFLNRGWGYCLRDEPTNLKFKYPTLPPGFMYDAAHQCRLSYGPDAELCDGIENVCSRLWCRVSDKCLTKLEAAADGTICDENKWCYSGNCTDIGERPAAVDGAWSGWTSWSPCTRTCGAGISVQKRHCDNPQPSNGGKYCLGERVRYRVCNIMGCDNSEPSFRQVQCSAMDVRPFKKMLYKWEAVQSTVNPCQLHCKPVNRYFSILAREMVIDGTPCRPGSRDMCIAGRCRYIGCDWKIDSTAIEDHCGVCHGVGQSCKTVKEKFETKKGHGYVEATVIPKGARNIRVEEVAAANNYLALKNNKGHYYLNGNWFIQWSGDYAVAGTTIRYRRSGNKESFMAAGPLKEQLHLMLLFQSENPGVSLEYTVPTENSSLNTKSEFKWLHSNWSECSATCGTGTQRSRVVCVETSSGQVEDFFCNHLNKLDDKQRVCNNNECPSRWWIGPWQHCSTSCGHDGIHSRTVICIQSIGKGEQIALNDVKCHHIAKPHVIKPCVFKVDCPKKGYWITSDWKQECSSNPCMVQWRSVYCNDMNIGCDLSQRPLDTRQCYNITCGQWLTSSWTVCSKTCGQGVQRRRVYCQHQPCDPDSKPLFKRPCQVTPCDIRTTPLTTAIFLNSGNFKFKNSIFHKSFNNISNYNSNFVKLYKPRNKSNHLLNIDNTVGKINSLSTVPVNRRNKHYYSMNNVTVTKYYTPKLTQADKIDSRHENGGQVQENVTHNESLYDKVEPANRNEILNEFDNSLFTIKERGTDDKFKVNSDINVSLKQQSSIYQTSTGASPPQDKSADTFNMSYRWITQSWTQCSKRCGNETRSRSVVCIDVKSRTISNEKYCEISQRPKHEENCQLPACLEWIVGDWSRCSPPCDIGERRRLVSCPLLHRCDRDKQPHDKELCNNTLACNTWVVGEWSKCSKSCGSGTQARMVQCINTRSHLLSDQCDPITKPNFHRQCSTKKCPLNYALTRICKKNKMGYQICDVLKMMGQCKKSFVQRNCCKTCGLKRFQIYRRSNKHHRRPSRGHRTQQ